MEYDFITWFNDISRTIVLFLAIYFTMYDKHKYEKKTLIKGGILFLVSCLITGVESFLISKYLIQGRSGASVFGFNVIDYALAYGVPLIFLCWLFDFKNNPTVIFYFVLAFFTIKIGTEIVHFIYFLLAQPTPYLFIAIGRIVTGIAWVLVVILLRRHKNMFSEKIEGMGIIFISFLNATIIITFTGYAKTVLEKYDERLFAAFTYVAELMASTLCISILSIYFNMLKKQNEKAILKSIIAYQKQNFNDFKENVDYINIQVHDLKHTIAYLESTTQGYDFTSTKEALKKFDNQNLSDNETLNLVFENKQLLLEKNHIAQIYNIYAVDLDKVLSKEEIFTFFSNAIDNVIEYYSSSNIKKEDRYLEISIKTVHKNIVIHIANKHEEEKKNLTLRTTKKEKKYHGYGTKSMKYIIEKHKGNITFALKDYTFSVDILLPIE